MSRKIAIVTGASRGLGKNAVEKLAKKGVDIILTYHSQQDAAQAVVKSVQAAGGKAVAVKLDAGNSSSFDAFVAEVKAQLQAVWQRDNFDFLVNNAGVGLHEAFAETTQEQFDLMMNIHLKGPFFLTQKLLPLMADGGRILNVSSGLARFALPGSSAYAIMKGAIEVLTRYQARELGERGITANVLAPGAIATDFSGGMVRDNPQVNKMVAGNTALGRVGLPDDIGDMVALMLSDEAGWMTAQRVEASGGMFI
ncbi:SDR family NAD(P)-dependent oxidoreductase [Rahnella inusitata]|jgi:NAD(P)-dependent dehydrogenase (short-subunit alcohol dehydrogenase family)|uniref:SDR family NAD(P)-dependent oxidoreductase n=1 Tax=Rahnella inusitata TaxID=58169 RepID=UPI001BC82F5C|nr:SDR family oxidoreductase [Rahnella inusitata]QUT15728.1 SDR family oxidoreductase [Rahnella inusitata]